MTTTEAKEIVSYILEWQFILMGVKERNELTKKNEFSKYSLNDIIKANKIMEGENNRKIKLADYHRKKGHKVNSYSISMTLADRAIAAVYTALSFPANGEMIALINDVGVGCVSPKY